MNKQTDEIMSRPLSPTDVIDLEAMIAATREKLAHYPNKNIADQQAINSMTAQIGMAQERLDRHYAASLAIEIEEEAPAPVSKGKGLKGFLGR